MIELLTDHYNIAIPSAVIIIMSCIQVSKIKINPWTFLRNVLRKIVGTENLKENFAELSKQVKEMDTRFEQEIFSLRQDSAEREAMILRTAIIDFAENIRCGALVSSNQFDEIHRKIDEYNKLVKKYEITNTFCEDEIRYIRNYIQKGYDTVKQQDEVI